MPNLRTSIGLFLIRYPMGLYFFIAGLNKVRGGIDAFVQMASPMIPPYAPASLGHAYLHCLPIFELLIGFLFMLGLFSRLSALIAFLMILSFTIAATGIHGTGGSPFQPNVIFMAVTLCILFAGPGSFSIDRFFRAKRRKSGDA